MEILKIHAAKIAKHGEVDYEAVVKLADNFNGADLRNVCTEAGMFAIRDERDYVVQVCVWGGGGTEGGACGVGLVVGGRDGGGSTGSGRTGSGGS